MSKRVKIRLKQTLGFTLGCGLVLACGNSLADDPKPETITQTGPATTIKILPQEPIAGFSSAEQLLLALETADEDLKTLSADIKYVRDFAIAGDTQERVGRLWFEDFSAAHPAKGTPRKRRFAIRFDTLQVGSKLEKKEQMYNFDGEWLVERFPAEKRMVKRQVVRLGESFDPLKTGEGPLPIPIGKKKDDILARYDATLLPPDDGLDELPIERMTQTKSFVKNSVQLMLVPRPGVSDDFTESRLWYMLSGDSSGKPGKLLPRMACTVNRAGDTSTVQLLNVAKNAISPIPATVFDTKSPEGWDVTVMPFRG